MATFDDMSHEQMLAWLDQADAGTVQAAADKLAAAAKEIHSIGEDLKVRPQWVTWKGEGADSFRAWAAKLATSTTALGDYSEHHSTWLGHAAHAIGTAKTSIPRDKGVDANIDAAKSAHNDPDSQQILSKNMAVRRQAADEMEKLGQAYTHSQAQMEAVTPPKFPPPPTDIQDPDQRIRDGGGYRGRPTGAVAQGASPSGSASGGERHVAEPGAGHVSHGLSEAKAVPPVAETLEPPTRMGIDSVDTLPQAPHAPVQATVGPTGPNVNGPVAPSTPPTVGMIPPVQGSASAKGLGNNRGTGPAVGSRGGAEPQANGRGTAKPGVPSANGGMGRPSATGARGPMMPGQNATAAAGRPSTGANPGRLPTNGGVAGGRPQPVTGKPTTGIPRGTVMGGESTAGNRGSTSQGGTGGRPGPTGARPAATGPAGRRVAGSTAENGGIVGGRAQQQGRANARSFSPGGSGLVRGGQSSSTDGPDEGTQRTNHAGRNGATPQGARPDARRDEGQRERRAATEDETTWQSDTERNVPPVIDDTHRNNER
ncbi:hypothetical protein ACFWVU_38475 [Streptomyces sp. NPDC058686]|uniref:hypothetical protein n=1 Tax=Streptomyces sp. NPDC058686 TaxID=3346599 RepID=UPI003657E700